MRIGLTLLALCAVTALCVGTVVGCDSGDAGRKLREAESSQQKSSEKESSEQKYRLAFNVLENEASDDYEVYVSGLDGSNQKNITSDAGVDWVYNSEGSRLYAVSDRNSERRQYHVYEVQQVDGDWVWRRVNDFIVSDSWIGVRSGGAELVVASKKDGQQDLYLLDANGKELRRLTNDPVADRDPAISHDGKQMVWASSRTGLDELWVMELQSGETRQLTHYPEELLTDGHGYHAGPPSWVPNQERISFCSKRNGVNSIFTIRVDGSDLQQITDGPFDRCWHSWSPDGRYLAFDGTNSAGHYDLYLKNLSTGETTQLTTGSRVEQAPVFLSVRNSD